MSPSEPRSENQLSPLHVLVLLGVSFLLMLLTVHAQGFVWSLLSHRPLNEALNQVSANVGCLGFAQLVGLGLPALIVLSRKGNQQVQRRTSGVRQGLQEAFAKVEPAPVLFAFLAGVCFQLPMCELAQLVSQLAPALAPSPEEEARMQALLAIDSAYRAVAIPMSLVVIAPLTEELLFRHFMQRSFLAHAPRAFVLPVVAMLFGAFHFDPHAFLAISAAGLALGALAHRHQSIRVSLAMHAGVNLVPVLVQPAWLPIPGLNIGAVGAHVPLVWLAPSALLFIVFFARAMRRTL